MLDFAQAEARALGFTRMILSTAQIQKAVDRFYRKNGFIQTRMEVAEAMTTKQAGGGLTRFYFEKMLLIGNRISSGRYPFGGNGTQPCRSIQLAQPSI